MPISALDAVTPAFQHAKQQLLQPFRMGQWAKLALVGFLAGELGSGGCSFRRGLGMPNGGTGHFPGLPSLSPLLFAGVISLIIVSASVIGLILLWLSSVMRFILFDSIIARRCDIGIGWSRRQRSGFQYFVWQILFTLAVLLGMGVLLGIPAGAGFALGWFDQPRQHLVPLVLGGIVFFFVFIAFLLISIVVKVFTKDFVVPQMAVEGISAFEGWRRLWEMMKTERSSYAGYLGLKILMAIGAAVILGIITAMVILLLLIPVGGVGIMALLLGHSAGLTWNLYTITLSIVVGLIVLAVILYLASLINVPAIVFFPAYAIYFFASRYPPLNALVYPAPPLPAPGASLLSP